MLLASDCVPDLVNPPIIPLLHPNATAQLPPPPPARPQAKAVEQKKKVLKLLILDRELSTRKGLLAAILSLRLYLIQQKSETSLQQRVQQALFVNLLWEARRATAGSPSFPETYDGTSRNTLWSL